MKTSIALLILITVSIGGYVLFTNTSQAPGGEEIACPADAKICPDGSAVGRVAPECEFAACPAAEAIPINVEKVCGPQPPALCEVGTLVCDVATKAWYCPPSEIDTSDWQTYRNEEYGFEIKYPQQYRTYAEEMVRLTRPEDEFFITNQDINCTISAGSPVQTQEQKAPRGWSIVNEQNVGKNKTMDITRAMNELEEQVILRADFYHPDGIKSGGSLFLDQSISVSNFDTVLFEFRELGQSCIDTYFAILSTFEFVEMIVDN